MSFNTQVRAVYNRHVKLVALTRRLSLQGQ